MSKNLKFIAVLTTILTLVTMLVGTLIGGFRYLEYVSLNNEIKQLKGSSSYDNVGFIVKKSTLDKMQNEIDQINAELDAQIKKLKEEAKSLGLDPNKIIGNEVDKNKQIELLTSAINAENARLQEAANNPVTEPTTQPTGKYKDGTYQGSAKGYQSTITVEVTIKNDVITNCVVLSENESYPQNATTVIPQQIVATNSTNVDTVSGSTYTSNAIINATNDALSKALIDPSQAPAPASQSTPSGNDTTTNSTTNNQQSSGNDTTSGSTTNGSSNGQGNSNGNDTTAGSTTPSNGNEDDEDDEYEDPEDSEDHEDEDREDIEDREDEEESED